MGRIAVLSDSHDNLINIRQATELIKTENPDMIIHLGDFVAPFAARILTTLEKRIIAVFGNNDGEKAGLKKALYVYGEIFEPPFEIEICGKNFLLSHSSLPSEILTNKYSHIDYFLHGHSHVVRDEKIGKIRILNPGEICGYLTDRATFGILDTESDDFKIFDCKF